ncbi:butyryl-CoA dehydrogenase [Lutibacter sp. Hel_I_33_5]|uniref:SDR family NAD(P)-dependent oxidoreductase n=1 Tax=Lutibacter sp. Hel_I_33_5 TaxID=1566289 RepID=UPI0011A01A58|nr:SDR family NAD(P)-dependent oxidoreductase [Lutibacter sp. Hel_I_33_5]TVZ57131.1 butyryl-CoA dehydrogenase [Lutibacter sp. Hel_I_33_5]
MKNFKNKIVVVTGAASGMGKSYAIEFAKLGAKLALCDFNFDGLKEVILEVEAIIGKENVYIQKVDVSNKEQIFDFANNVKTTLGNAHVVINNAGIEGDLKPFYNIEIDDFKRLMDVNFYGVVYGSKAFLPQLVANKEGALVNVSSVFGLIAPPINSDYAASKFAVRGFTESLMAEFHKSPISIHCLHPGGIKTNISKKEHVVKHVAKNLTTSPEKIVKHVIKSIVKKQPKIVYGNGAFKFWFISNFVPKKWLFSFMRRELKSDVNTDSFKTFNANF